MIYAVILAVGKDQPKFVAIGCVNIVVGANAGGAFSPFGDITTLMVWQKGVLEFATFFKLFVPSVVNFVIPALIMQFAVPPGSPTKTEGELAQMKTGGMVIVGLFLLTIITAVSFHKFLHLPPVFGMMIGLAYLKFFGYYLRQRVKAEIDRSDMPTSNPIGDNFDLFNKIARAAWDTLFFFYGVILAVGGLGFTGYLGMTSKFMYGELGATTANVLVGILSAIVDNIPVMFAVLTMNPEMDQVQWLLVTLTAGVGGGLLSIGSAAGVALMGQARGQYTFFGHLKWTPVIALGNAGSVWAHFLING
jgi:Na+/H+ antiporter NhaD/arsenite permease-like protein